MQLWGLAQDLHVVLCLGSFESRTLALNKSVIYYGLLMFEEATNQNAAYMYLYCLVSWNNSASWDLFSNMTQGCLLRTMLNRSHYQVKSHFYLEFRHIFLAHIFGLFPLSAKIMAFFSIQFFPPNWTQHIQFLWLYKACKYVIRQVALSFLFVCLTIHSFTFITSLEGKTSIELQYRPVIFYLFQTMNI